MNISKLLEGVDVEKLINVDKTKEIDKLVTHHGEATKNSVYFAIKGGNSDGNIYTHEVLKKGGVVVSDDKSYAHNLQISGGKNFILTDDARKAMSFFSSNFFGNPQEKLKIIAVIGTNGKTSTACIVRDIFEYSGIRTGIIGTLETKFEEKIYQNDLTTPDPIQLFEILQDMHKRGAKVVVMEWSAHAIALRKLACLTCDIGIFTNLSQDHLDFFGDMESYAKVKKSIFTSKHIKTAVVNSDDVVGREIIANANMPVLSYGIENVSDVFCVFAKDMQKYKDKIFSGSGAVQCVNSNGFFINYLDEISEIHSNLQGKFNTYNLLSAITTAKYFGIDFQSIKNAVCKIEGVCGRYQTVANNAGIDVVVDYAHTPDGMENILKEMKLQLLSRQDETAETARLICVFGCGGNRDSSKRKIMGEVSEKYADLIVVTSDNPRFENPADIASEILQGVENQEKAVVILDREDGIKFAISSAKKGDSIAILGKGHEEYIDEMGTKRYFSDVEVVKKYI